MARRGDMGDLHSSVLLGAIAGASVDLSDGFSSVLPNDDKDDSDEEESC